MEQFSLPLAEDESAADVFDMERLAIGEPTVPTPAADGPPRSASTPTAWHRVRPIGPVHFALATVIGAAIWVAWPAEKTASKRSASTTVSVPEVAERPGGSAQPSVPAISDAEKSSASNTAKSDALTNTDLVRDPGSARSIDSHILDLQAQQAKALVDSVDALHIRVAALEQKAADASHPGVETSAKTTSFKHRAQPPKSPLPDRATIQAPALPGFELNTVYRGQAWITHDGRSYVVQVGSMIDGVRISAIDPVRRVVNTSRGVIR